MAVSETFITRIRKTGIVGDAGNILLFQVVALVFTLVSSVLVARALGPENKGIYDLYSLLLSLLVEFSMLGLPAGLLYSVMTRGDSTRSVHGTGLALVLAISGVVVVTALLVRQWLAPFFPGLPMWALVLAIVSLPFSCYMLVWSNMLVGQGRAVRLQQYSTLFGGVNLLIVITLYSADALTVRNYLYATLVQAILVALFSFFILKRGQGALQIDREVASRSFRFGLPVFIGGIANFLHFKVDQLMIGAWVGLEGVGLYALSVRWAEMLFLLDAAILSSSLYRIGSSSPETSRKLSRDVMLILFGVNLLAAMALSAFVWFGFEFVYGAEYNDSIRPLLLLLPGVLFWSAMKPLANYLNYSGGKVKLVAWFSAFGLLLNIILNYVLIRQFEAGIDGAAIASSISYILVGSLVAWAAVRWGGKSNASH